MKILCGKNKNGPPLKKKSSSKSKNWAEKPKNMAATKIQSTGKINTGKKKRQEEAEADLCMNRM